MTQQRYYLAYAYKWQRMLKMCCLEPTVSPFFFFLISLIILFTTINLNIAHGIGKNVEWEKDLTGMREDRQCEGLETPLMYLEFGKFSFSYFYILF